jgi:uridine kinase
VGIGGGTGSGKTTVANKILARLPAGSGVMVDLDSYYLDQSDLSPVERKAFNYDHPDAFDWPLLRNHVSELMAGRDVEKPVYSFVDSVRTRESTHVPARQVVILEGILVLHDAWLRERMSVRLFVDNDSDVRLARRLARDLKERGRTVEQVLDQYFRSVRPMHLGFVWPSRRYADVLIPNEGVNDVAVGMVSAGLRAAVEAGQEPKPAPRWDGQG